jgi:hypothetical protein
MIADLINNAQHSTLKDIAASYKTHDDLTRWVKHCFRELGVEDAHQCWSEQFYDLQLSANKYEAAMSRILDAACSQWNEIAAAE